MGMTIMIKIIINCATCILTLNRLAIAAYILSKMLFKIPCTFLKNVLLLLIIPNATMIVRIRSNIISMDNIPHMLIKANKQPNIILCISGLCFYK